MGSSEIDLELKTPGTDSVCSLGSVDCVEIAEVNNCAEAITLEVSTSFGSVACCEIDETSSEGAIVLCTSGETGSVS